MLTLDLRYAIRVLRGSPGFTAAAILTLGLGIGANTALFSVFDALLIKSLPVHEPDRLVVLSMRNARAEENLELSYPLFIELRDRNHTLADLAAGTSASNRVQVRVPPSREIETVSLASVSGNFFEMLGVYPARGRLFTAAMESSRTSEPTMVLDYGYWQTRFGGSESVVGETVLVQNVAFTVVGVAPQGFFGHVVGESPDVWIPAVTQPRLSSASDYLGSTGVDWVRLIGRLRPGVTHQAALSDLQTIYRQIEHDWKPTPKGNGLVDGGTLLVGKGVRGFSDLRARFERPLKTLTIVVALVLLVACINVASLLTARASSREREIAIRLAIGAGTRQLARLFLAESLLLSALGGACGLLLGFWGTDALLPLLGDRSGLPPLAIRADARLLAFTALISVTTGVLFGTLPVWRYAGHARAVPLGKGVSTRPRLALGRALVVAQLALSLVLVVVAALFVGTLQNLRTVDAGFDRARVLMLRIDPHAAGYDAPRRAVLNQDLRATIAALPGVQSTSQSGIGLMGGRSRTCCITVPGYTATPGERMAIRTNDVTPGYFSTLGMSLLAGRDFVEGDSTATSLPVVVNEAFARKYFDGHAVGRSFAYGTGPAMPIVGIVADARYDGLRETSVPLVFFPAKRDAPLQSLEVRTAGDSRAIMTAVRRAVAGVDPALPLREMFTIEQLVDSSLARERLMARISGFFGVLALVLACVGVYGLLAQLVTRRTNEIGIRIALGASQEQVMAMVLRETTLLVVPGILVGLAAAAVGTRMAAALLFGLTPRDPAAFVLATASLTAVAIVAAWLPARRAANVTPLAALRHE
jgi:predicted permease